MNQTFNSNECLYQQSFRFILQKGGFHYLFLFQDLIDFLFRLSNINLKIAATKR